MKMRYLRRQWHWAMSLLLCMTLSGCLSFRQFSFWATQPAVETLGNFERLTYADKEWGEYDELHYRGQRLSFADPAHQFGYSLGTYTWLNALITFTLPKVASGPALIVNVGHPNHETLFFLVREVGDVATVDYICRMEGAITAAWLDNPSDAATAHHSPTLRRLPLAGEGRWLLLSDHCLLDVQKLQVLDKRYEWYKEALPPW